VRPVTRFPLLPALLGAAFFAGLATQASRAAAEEPEETPSRSEPAPKPDLPAPATRLNLALTGVGMTAGFYGAALGASLIWNNGAWAPAMRVPIVGPWMAMPDLKCGTNELNCNTALVVVRIVLAGIDGVGQAGGVLVALESLFLPVQSQTRAKRASAPQHARVRPVPFVAGRDTIGIGVVGEL